MAVRILDGAQREQRFDALAPRLADADEQAGGHRNAEFTGSAQGREPLRRRLVGGAEVRTAPLAQPVRRALEHQTHRSAHGPKTAQVRSVHDAGVQMGQQPRLLQHEFGHAREVIERAGRTLGIESPARRRVACFGFVAEREQGFLAVGGPAGERDAREPPRPKDRRLLRRRGAFAKVQ